MAESDLNLEEEIQNFDYDEFCADSSELEEEIRNFDLDAFCAEVWQENFSKDKFDTDVKIIHNKIRGFLMSIMKIIPKLSTSNSDNENVEEHLKFMITGIERLITHIQNR